MNGRRSDTLKLPTGFRRRRNRGDGPSSGFTARPSARDARLSVMGVFGTRPEIIKLAPVLAELGSRRERFDSLTVMTSQHADLSRPFLDLFDIQADFDLRVMQSGQSLNQLCARVVARLDPILCERQPNLVLVQGDTTTAYAGAVAAWHRRIPVGHVEAGLRSGTADR